MSTPNLTEKLSFTINIKHVFPIVLKLGQMNYAIWRLLFEIHCIGYGVADHLTPPVLPSSSFAEKPTENAIPITKTPTWQRNDSIVKSLIYATLSLPLLHLIFKKKTPACEVWVTIENALRDNKNNKVMQLDNELRNISVGDSSMVDYCNRVKYLAD